MNDLKQKQLQKEIAYYTNLLKKHETTAYGRTKLHPLEKQSQNSCWKQPALPMYKMIQTSSIPTSTTKLHVQIASTNTVSQNKRTVLFNGTNFTKATSGTSQNIESAKIPANKVFSKRTVIHAQKPVIIAKNSSETSLISSNSSEKLVSSGSVGLLEEIEYLTKLLENSNEKQTAITKHNATNSSFVNRKVIDNRMKSCDISSSQYQNKSKITFHNTQTVNLPLSNLKQNNESDVNVNKIIINSKSNVQLSKSTNFSKYSLIKSDVKPNCGISDSQCQEKSKMTLHNMQTINLPLSNLKQNNKSDVGANKIISNSESNAQLSKSTNFSKYSLIKPDVKPNCGISGSQCQEKSKMTLHNMQTVNLPLSNLKQNGKLDMNANRIVSNSQSNFEISKATNFSKYSFKKIDAKPSAFSKTKYPYKVENKIEKHSTLNKYVSGSRTLTHNVYSDSDKLCKQNNLNLFKIMTPKHQILDKRHKGPSKYKVINKHSSATSKVNSPSTLKAKSSLRMKIKSPVSSKIVTKHQTVYCKINKRNQSPRMKHLKNKFVFRRNSPANQKAKKVNLKYKVVNKSNAQSTNKVLNRQNYKSTESSMLDKTDSFIDLLDNSDIDNLEQRLLAVSTSLTATPKPAKCPLNNMPNATSAKSCLKKTPKCKVLASKYKVVNKNVASKVNSKFVIKKTPAKKFKVLSSKYKVINKNAASKINSKLVIKKTPPKKFNVLSSKYKVVNKNMNAPKNFSFTSKDSTPKNSVRKVCKKIYSTKFTIVNKHSSVNARSPIMKTNSTLVKRLYKSKSTIINKNVSPTNHSAKLIKSKYLGLNKRKSPNFQKHSLYPRRSMKLQRFKGPYIDSRLLSKLNRYQKHMTYSRGARRFSKIINYTTNGRYHKNNSTTYKQKRHNVYIQSPVLLIRGTRYSLSSTGKTLKRLPTKGQTKTNKIPRRIIFGGKPYVRTSENRMKVVNSPPISQHIASRVLHRSISRVITASSKKNLTKVNTYCMFYNRFGRCNRGVKCTYIHDPSKIAVCTRFLRGTCKTEGCPFSHEVSPGKMAICSFFLVDACDKVNCPYRHEPLSPNAVLCKAFVQGYCPNGKECKKAHILICPKFILGECEKGSTCAYPHPPQKVKKNVPKDTVVDKDVIPLEEKEDDALLEKVTRYFLPLCGNPAPCKNTSEKDNSIQFFVPKQRRQLEEQPAFIPLSNTPVTSRLKQPNQN